MTVYFPMGAFLFTGTSARKLCCRNLIHSDVPPGKEASTSTRSKIFASIYFTSTEVGGIVCASALQMKKNSSIDTIAIVFFIIHHFNFVIYKIVKELLH